MKNIKAKQESLSNWREEFDIDEAKVDDKHSPEGKEKERNKRKYGNWPVSQGAQTSVRRGIHWSNRGDKKRKGAKVEEHVEGGIQVQNVADGLNFTEVETVDIIKPEPIKGASNWKLEMVTEMLISEGYNDEEIVTILSEELPKIPLGPILTGAVRGAWNLSTKGVRGAYNLGKGARGIVNRGVRDTKLTGDIISTAKKLRKPDGVSITKSPNVSSKGGGLVKSFKGFMQNVKNAGSNLVNRTKGKLNRTDIKTNTPTTTKKPVEVLGGAATNTATKISKPMRNITPATERIKNVTDRVKVGAASGAGVVAGAAASKLNKGTFTKSKASGYVVDMDGYDPSDKQTPETIKKINDLTYKQMQRDKVDGPTQGKTDTIDGKKVSITHSSVYGKEEPKAEPTKRELRNKRNEYLSSPEGKRERRDAKLKNKISGNRPTGKTKWVGKNTTWVGRSGNVIAPRAYKEEVAIDENRMASHTAGMSDGQKDAATSSVSRSTADKMGRRSDEAAFKGRKKKTSARYSSTSGKKRKNTTGRGQPEQYRKAADSPENEGRYPYGRSKIVQGKGSFKGLKKEEFENIQELDNMGGPAAIGAVVAAGAGLAKSAYDGIKKTADNLKKNKEEKQQKIKNLTQSYSWRDELGLIEGNRTKGFLGSGHKKDYSKGPNEKIYVDYTKIRANAPVKTDTKVG